MHHFIVGRGHKSSREHRITLNCQPLEPESGPHGLCKQTRPPYRAMLTSSCLPPLFESAAELLEAPAMMTEVGKTGRNEGDAVLYLVKLSDINVKTSHRASTTPVSTFKQDVCCGTSFDALSERSRFALIAELHAIYRANKGTLSSLYKGGLVSISRRLEKRPSGNLLSA